MINVWSKSDDTAQSATQSSGHQLFAQATLGIGLPVGSVPVPIGEVTPDERAALIEEMRSNKMYDLAFDQKNVQKTRKDGRLLYTYNLKIQTILYVQMMQQFAKDIGLHELDSVDPNTYQTSEPLSVKIIVDAHSKQLVTVDIGQGYVQNYKAYGVPVNVSIPQHTISDAELKKRLSEL